MYLSPVFCSVRHIRLKTGFVINYYLSITWKILGINLIVKSLQCSVRVCTMSMYFCQAQFRIAISVEIELS